MNSDLIGAGLLIAACALTTVAMVVRCCVECWCSNDDASFITVWQRE